MLSVQLAGIRTLRLSGHEHSADYYTQFYSLFCAFLQYPPGGRGT